MDTGTRLLMIDDEVICKGTSLYHAPSDEIAWVAGTGDGAIIVETVNDAHEIPVASFKRGIRDGALVVESQPTGQIR